MPKLVLEGDAAGAVKATGEVVDKVAKLKAEFKAAASEAAQLTREAKRIVEENATPQEHYNQQMERLSKLFVAGKLNVEQMDRALGNYGKQLDEATKGQGKHNEAHQEGFGQHAVDDLLKYAAGFVTIEKGIELVTDAIRQQQEQEKKAGEGLGKGIGPAKKISQVSGSPEEFQQNIAEMRALQRITGADEPGTAADIVVAEQQARLQRTDRQLISEWADKNMPPAELPDFIRDVKGFQVDYKNAGNFETVGKQAIVGARESGGHLSPDELLKVAERVAQQARDNNETPEQTIAKIATIGRGQPNFRRTNTAVEEYYKTGEGLNQSQYQLALEQIRKSPGNVIPDYIGDVTGLSSARSAEREENTKKLTDQDLFGERERLGQAIYSGRQKRAAKGGRLARFGEWLDETLTTKTWQDVIEDEARTTGWHGGQYINGRGFGDVDAETAKDIRDYLSRLHGEAKTQTQIMQRSDRALPPARGLQE